MRQNRYPQVFGDIKQVTEINAKQQSRKKSVKLKMKAPDQITMHLLRIIKINYFQLNALSNQLFSVFLHKETKSVHILWEK
jgi:hypothetical protein